ncbi:hypothetical protein GOP47_0003786 [Adiantum capillus-veneris]|uniref:Uncharacterized protein n=1 Tax=Adiantum capillus-veneris TaxID=13818 RepID=A0A9D4ZLZ7_ADICA|nr:hypothetical protein GOP47_0003786 [Adiantum capillus-veneris]
MTGRHAAVRERRATSPAILTDKAPEDTDNPFQVWYKDDWWRFTEDKAGNPAFALINNGSKAALKADADAAPSLGVNQANTNGVQEVWYKVPAASPLEDSNSSFFIICKMNGKALKGSTKPGDKVILTKFDPLDYNFVWSKDRSLSNGQRYLAINLANSDSKLHWFLPPDNEYQNEAYNHPLTLREATSASDTRSQWSFVPFTS